MRGNIAAATIRLPPSSVIPAKAGIQCFGAYGYGKLASSQVVTAKVNMAFAGMTRVW